jgi:putative cardiolipin synthase
VLTNSLAANDVPLVHTGYARYRVDLLRSGVHLYELSPSRPDRDDAVAFPGASVGRLHAKTAVIDHRTVYIGSMNLDPRSEGENTELGMLAECPELASDVIRVLDMSRQRSSYRLTLAPDGEGLEWRTPADRGDRVLSQEPEVTPLMRLQTLLIAPFVPEQLL